MTRKKDGVYKLLKNVNYSEPLPPDLLSPTFGEVGLSQKYPPPPASPALGKPKPIGIPPPPPPPNQAKPKGPRQQRKLSICTLLFPVVSR